MTGSLALVAVALSVSASLAGNAVGTAADRRGILVFEREDGLYTMDSNGQGERKIDGSLAGDGNPVWSPNGRQIAFDSRRGGTWDVYVMDASGRNVRRLTRSPSDDDFPRWAPNGKSITFRSDRGGNRWVYAINVRTSAARRVASGTYPDWAPSGRIFFADSGDLWSVRPYGAARRVHDLPERTLVAARISDGGTRLAYVTENWDIFVAKSDGSSSRRLTTSAAKDTDPGWSPDGEWITFDSERAGALGVYVMRADGSEQTPLAKGYACCADWSVTAAPR
jgi:TolB protein